MKILIIKLGAIGDIIHTLPALAALRAGFPSAEISWVAEQRSAEILRGNKLLDNLIEVDTKALRGGRVIEKMLIEGAKQIKNLRQYDFDLAIDFQGLLKSGMIAKLSGAKIRWGFSRADLREPAARVFYTNTAKIPGTAHVIRRNLALAGAALGMELPADEPAFPIFTTDEHENEAAAIADRAGPNFAILNPAGGWVTKLWHPEKFGRLADLLWDECGIHSVVVTGPNESALASGVLAASKSGKTILAEPSLKGFYELAKRARIYIGGDTGPTHLAIAAGAPVVGVFGPTEWWRNGSLNPNDLCVERVDIGCRVDCHRRTCSNWICMDIGPETLFEAVLARLRNEQIKVAVDR
ncbi:MAG TPA: lipopolysaccharide heptosyltransferase I [Pyrinomonadaceae bacterium]|nr:lipopolysaccharide heptosyltransferase I [Pyrinomonadaceae bacterium]